MWTGNERAWSSCYQYLVTLDRTIQTPCYVERPIQGDHLTKATTFPRYQNFPSQSPIVVTYCERPPHLVGDRAQLFGWRFSSFPSITSHLTRVLIWNTFAVRTMLLTEIQHMSNSFYFYKFNHACMHASRLLPYFKVLQFCCSWCGDVNTSDFSLSPSVFRLHKMVISSYLWVVPV